MVALWLAKEAAEDAVNVTTVDPAATLTVAGTERAVELARSATSNRRAAVLGIP